MAFLTRNGQRVFFEDTGGAGLPVFFTHGFILDHTIWTAQVEALSDRHRCIAMDVRGHGMSEVAAPFDYWEIADDAVAILDELGIDKAVFVGHSQGGWVSMSAALAHPERVAGLVLVGTAADLDAPEVTAGYDDWATRWTTDGPVGELQDTMLAVQFGVDAPKYAELWAGKWHSRPPSGFKEIWQSVSQGRHDLLGRLPEITAPALIIHGNADTSFSMQRARDMQSALTDCRGLVEVEGAPHSLSVTHPGPVTDALAPFVTQLAGTPTTAA
jgi:3-oxoadipate enol-lactonase